MSGLPFRSPEFIEGRKRVTYKTYIILLTLLQPPLYINDMKINKIKPKNPQEEGDLYPKESDYFDDCPICQAQKKADKEGRQITMGEIMKAFEETSKLPGTVCGFNPNIK